MGLYKGATDMTKTDQITINDVLTHGWSERSLVTRDESAIAHSVAHAMFDHGSNLDIRLKVGSLLEEALEQGLVTRKLERRRFWFTKVS